MTAGWDQNVLIWDMRTNSTQNYIYGPLICGDALDFKNNLVLTGSWREDKQLQLWDIRKTSKSINLQWENLGNEQDSQSFIYSCQFSKYDDSFIIAGSAGSNQIRLFDRNSNNMCIDALTSNIKKGVFSIDWANKKNYAVYGVSDGTLGYFEAI
ncbi:WD repeat protein [Ichthyophthirius multifiliis]|uniref:WD repeat protein n=1 Tax=Ichthyophthirius multifiliis TaxID=5932 RepID=G0QMW7_ICHMU|nr:WD repeat protein [Ichthyophthirius multifiliis]EGR33438.1 WD repeat protein [Ichthyophthirius multifiliis]|eukprot:XP_004037424.1 WD repeat protein [Ichthyophthirius multifiliis]